MYSYILHLRQYGQLYITPQAICPVIYYTSGNMASYTLHPGSMVGHIIAQVIWYVIYYSRGCIVSSMLLLWECPCCHICDHLGDRDIYVCDNINNVPLFEICSEQLKPFPLQIINNYQPLIAA